MSIFRPQSRPGRDYYFQPSPAELSEQRAAQERRQQRIRAGIQRDIEAASAKATFPKKENQN